MGYSQIDNLYLDSPNGLTNAEFRVLMCIQRLTAGFHRNKYNIPYSQLTEMSGVQGISIICQSLKRKRLINFESDNGKSSMITILKPVKSVNRLPKKAINSLNDTHSVSTPLPLTHLNGSRGAKEKFKENLKKDILFLEYKKSYPENKFDDDTAFDVWKSLTDRDKKMVIGGLFYAREFFKLMEDQKFIPKASNYLLKRYYMKDEILIPYKRELQRNKEKIEFNNYINSKKEN